MQSQNRLLEGLPTKAFDSIRNRCELVDLTKGAVLYEPGERIQDVYFPIQSVVSLVAGAAGNEQLEVALVSNEGMIGVPLLLGADRKPLRVLVQKSGRAWHMKADAFRRMTDSQRALRNALNEYVLLRLAQVTQNAICANAHGLEARLARRLLTMQDRSHSRRFPTTQELLATLLGVPCPSVTLLTAEFQRQKLIQYQDGTFTILDRNGLESRACECYRAAPGLSPAEPADSSAHAG